MHHNTFLNRSLKNYYLDSNKSKYSESKRYLSEEAIFDSNGFQNKSFLESNLPFSKKQELTITFNHFKRWYNSLEPTLHQSLNEQDLYILSLFVATRFNQVTLINLNLLNEI
jgi:hypothetical protein